MSISRQQRLRAFLKSYEEQPVEWRVSDCSAAPAKWVEAEREISIAFPEYGTREEAARLIAEAGGLVNIWNERLPLSARIAPPELGDVGIVSMRKLGDVGVIIGAPGIALLRREEGGWHAISPSSYVKVWALD